ncbi:MAG TPA: hypothetical protein VG538_06000 [Vicinamibacterales bacterium]|nr:hypothetical protein [Vicinamibacterales bacterium]
MSDYALTPYEPPARVEPVKETRAETRHRLEARRQAEMVRRHGVGPEGATCGECASFVTVEGNTRNYLKCRRYGLSRAESTDWRAKWAACGAFTPRDAAQKG